MDASHRLFLRFFGVSAFLHVAFGAIVVAIVQIGGSNPDPHVVAVEVSIIEPERGFTATPVPVAAGHDAAVTDVVPPMRPSGRPAPAPIDAPRLETDPSVDPASDMGIAEAIAPRFRDGPSADDRELATAPFNEAGLSDATSEGGAAQGDAVRAWLERHKRYPRAATQRGIEGEATLQLDLDANGGVRSTAIVRSSGHGVLDDEVARMVARATPFPKETRPVSGVASYRIVIEFHLEEK